MLRIHLDCGLAWLTHVDGAWEGRALSQHSETVAQISHVVLRLHFIGIQRFVTLYKMCETSRQPLSHNSLVFTSLVMFLWQPRFQHNYLPGELGLDRIWRRRIRWCPCPQYSVLCGKWSVRHECGPVHCWMPLSTLFQNIQIKFRDTYQNKTKGDRQKQAHEQVLCESLLDGQGVR